MKISQKDLEALIMEGVKNVLNENVEDESVFGNMMKFAGKDAWNGIKRGAQTVADKAKGAYNAAANYGSNLKTKGIEAEKEKVDAMIDQMNQQLEQMTAEDAQKVAQYRSQLMSKLNQDVNAYASKLKQQRSKFGNKIQTQQNKSSQYGSQLAQRYAQQGQPMMNKRQVAESIDRIVRRAVKKNLR